MSHKKSGKNVLSGVLGLISIAALAMWQFYSFVTFKNAEGVVDLQGGTHHLWWAIGLALAAFVLAFFILSVLVRYDRNDEMHITSQPS